VEEVTGNACAIIVAVVVPDRRLNLIERRFGKRRKGVGVDFQ
jgi:hypothetical protein